MKVVVCYKWVVDEADIKVDPSTRALNLKDAARKVSLYDRNAIEAGMRLREASEGLCIALSSGSEEVVASRKDVLSRGPDEGYVVVDPRLGQADSYVTSEVLAAAVKKLEGVDLLICGEGSADAYAQQVGPRVAQILGWPVVTYVTKLDVQGDRVVAHRAVEEGIEVLECRLPAIITILGDSNMPRIPGLKQVMGAGKKPFATLTPTDLGLGEAQLTPRVAPVHVRGNVADRKRIIIEGSPETASAEAVRLLIKEGVLN